LPSWSKLFTNNKENNFYPSYWQETFQYKAWIAYLLELNDKIKIGNYLEKEFNDLNNHLGSQKEDLILNAVINIKCYSSK
jgi:hypothetical protein